MSVYMLLQRDLLNRLLRDRGSYPSKTRILVSLTIVESLMNLVITRMDNYLPAYIYMPKLEPSSKKETFVGYCKSSKDYIIYIPGLRQIEVSRDVNFEEEMAIRKGRGFDMEINDDEEMRSSPP